MDYFKISNAIMPNHVHGIIEINRDLANDFIAHNQFVVGTGRDMSLRQIFQGK